MERFIQSLIPPTPGLRAAVAGGEDYPLLETLADASWLRPTLVGDAREMARSLRALHADGFSPPMQDAGRPVPACLELIRTQRAELLLQGSAPLRDVLSLFLNRRSPLWTGPRLAALSLVCLPDRPPFALAALPSNFPTADKRAGIEAAVSALHVLGWARPSVALLSGEDCLDPDVPETFVASELDRMGINGEVTGFDPDGPITYSCALSPSIARLRQHYAGWFGRPLPGDLPPVSGLEGFSSPHCGSFDLLVAPDWTSGSLLAECLSVTAGAVVATAAVGGAVPVGLLPRGTSPLSRMLTLRLTAALAGGGVHG